MVCYKRRCPVCKSFFLPRHHMQVYDCLECERRLRTYEVKGDEE